MRGKTAEEGEARGRTEKEAEEREEGAGTQEGSRVGWRRLREMREVEDSGEMGRKYKETGEKGSWEANAQGWASPAAHNSGTPQNPL